MRPPMWRLTILVVLAVVSAACQLGPGGAAGGPTIEAEFDRAFNLFEGGEVRVLGVASGSIEDVIVEPGSDRVRVRMLMHPDVEVPAEAEATVVEEALLGERYVQISPAYTGGEKMEEGDVIPLERTEVPIEFEEAFQSLNDTLQALDEDEVARLVTNLAETLDGQGQPLADTLESVRGMISALRQSDQELVQLANTLVDLNETIGSRADAMGQQFADLGVVAESLASDRADLDRTISSLLRMIRVMGDVVATHRGTLTRDLETLTQVGRTINRDEGGWSNLGEYELFLEGQAELFRHAERVIPLDRNWIPVVNHTGEGIEDKLADRLTQRLVGLCLRLDVAGCADEDFWVDLLEGEFDGGDLCLEPVAPCPEEDGGAVPLGEAVDRAFEEVPELGERLREERRAEQQGGSPTEEETSQSEQDDPSDIIGGLR